MSINFYIYFLETGFDYCTLEPFYWRGFSNLKVQLEFFARIHCIFIAGNQLSDNDAQRIGEALKNNLSLNTLDLSYNSFGEDGGIHLATGIVIIYYYKFNNN